MDESARSLRFKIFEYILAHCRPPTVQELSVDTGHSSLEVGRLLEKLKELHHLTLYSDGVPSPTPLAMVHPFSHLPSPYVVIQGQKTWFANCAWCSFGLAAMLSPSKVQISVLTHQGKNLKFEVADGKFEDEVLIDQEPESLTKFAAVFSAPPSLWWKDVRFACGTIQICNSEEISSYHTSRGFYSGGSMDLDTLWKLSKSWYGDKHSYNYERKSPEEVKALYESLGLTSEYWST